LVVPLQIGARDVAFPFLNNLSFWFTVVGVILVNVSLGVGEFAQTDNERHRHEEDHNHAVRGEDLIVVV
ncbi:cbb3-type cytochrome c oxidase subunit I, partial [Escherichia coli]